MGVLRARWALLFLSAVLSALIGCTCAQTPGKPAELAARRSQGGNLVGHGGPVKAIAVSVDGKRALTGSFDYSAILWDISGNEPKVLHRFTDHSGAVNAVIFLPSSGGGDLGATGADDGVVRLWDLATGKLLKRFEGHDRGTKIAALAATPWLLVSAGWDRTARVWHLDTLSAGPVLRDHGGPVNAVAFGTMTEFDNGGGVAATLYSAGQDGIIRAFRIKNQIAAKRPHTVANGALLRRVLATGVGIAVLHASEPFRALSAECCNDDIVFGLVDGEAGVVGGQTGQVVARFPAVRGPILSVDVMGDTIALGSATGELRVFQAGQSAAKIEHRHPFGPVWALAFNTNASALYHAGLDDFVTYWPFSPRASFEPVDTSNYPRRFQLSGKPETVVAKGEIQFARKCSICHTLTPDSGNRAGPTLHNLFGRRIATLPGYNYSPELKTLDIEWTPETLSKLFEIGPDKFTPGSKMPLQVMSDAGDRDALIAFLEIATRPAPTSGPVDGTDATPQKAP